MISKCFKSTERSGWFVSRRALAAVTGLLLLLALSSVHALYAQSSQPGDELFLARTYTNAAGHQLHFRLLVPKNYDRKQKYPVILYLHGAAARGNDNTEPLNWGPRLFLDESLRQKHGFFLVVPQCPKNEGWLDWSLTGPAHLKESQSLELALELVSQELPRQFSMDPKRRYLTGVSMGGHAVWVVLVRRPGFFAAAVPVCAGGTARMVTKAAAKYPVWAFHSDDDHLVPVQEARDLVKAWRAYGGTAKYTEYTGLRHSSWKKAYVDPAMFDWLFAQHLP